MLKVVALVVLVAAVVTSYRLEDANQYAEVDLAERALEDVNQVNELSDADLQTLQRADEIISQSFRGRSFSGSGGYGGGRAGFGGRGGYGGGRGGQGGIGGGWRGK